MGFFSWNCRRCGHSILSQWSTDDINQWMKECVAITPHDNIHIGEYDGYGSIDGAKIWERGEPECYHRRCWELTGKPVRFKRASEPSYDQGYFFNHEHDLPCPT